MTTACIYREGCPDPYACLANRRCMRLRNPKPATGALTSNQRNVWREFKKRVEEGCSSCEFDEAEGGLFNHCARCQLAITTMAYELVYTLKGHMQFPDETPATLRALADEYLGTLDDSDGDEWENPTARAEAAVGIDDFLKWLETRPPAVEDISAIPPAHIEQISALAHDLFNACVDYHQAVDTLFAMLILKTKDEKPHGFLPSKSGHIWDAVQKGYALIGRARTMLEGIR